jgi:hypothetical protein
MRLKKSKKAAYEVEQHKLRRLIRAESAPAFRDRFPRVVSLVIEMSFKESEWGATSALKRRSYDSTSKAFFEEECLYHDCIDGGFDLSEPVSDLIKSGNQSSSSFLICQGWQDEARLGRHMCLLTMKYTIKVTYSRSP